MEPIINRTDAPVPARQVPPPPPKESGVPSSPPPPVNQVNEISALAKKAAASGPDLRADEIERGKHLAADPNYPSDEILEKLAEGLLRSDDFRNAL